MKSAKPSKRENSDLPGKKLLSISEVAEIFGVHQDTLRNWEKEGKLKPLRVGARGDRRYRPEDLAKVVDSKIGDAIDDLTDSKLSLAELKQFLWKSADILRGKIDSADYKKYIFGLLFYKRMSDVWDEEYQNILDQYHDQELALADYNHRFQVPKDCRWEIVQQKAEGIGATLNAIFDKLANANTPKLEKIFTDLDFADKDRFPNETLQRLVNHFSKHRLGISDVDSDVLGDSYEYLIEQFAASGGKKGGEFYTPRTIERAIMKMLKPQEKNKIYDPTCGSGGFLLEAFNYLKEKEGEKVAKSLYLNGQELNLDTFAISKINMFLHGLDLADIRRGDTLATPQFLKPTGALQEFDVVVANFPYSIKEWDYESFAADKFGRLAGYEMPPRKNADYAFILHIIKSLNSKGRAGIVVPHGVLFKSDVSGKIREQMIKNDLIEAVIAMPEKLFFTVSIPVAIFILNKSKPAERKNKILFIDAEKDYQEGKKQNTLRNQDIEKIVTAFDGFKDVAKYAHVADLKEIAEENEYNLNVRRYVDSSDIEEVIDVAAVAKEVEQLQREQAEADKKVRAYLRELKY